MAKDKGNKGRVALGNGQTPSPSTSPFAALAGLRDALPAGTTATTTTATTTTPAKALPFGDKVVVRLERKGHGGKTVTIVSGIKAEHRETFATSLKKKLGTGARIEDDDIVVQGDVVDRAIAFCEAEGAKKVVRGTR